MSDMEVFISLFRDYSFIVTVALTIQNLLLVGILAILPCRR